MQTSPSKGSTDCRNSDGTLHSINSRCGLETFAYINHTARDAGNYGTQFIWYYCKKYKINTHNWLGEEKSCYSYCNVPLTMKCILLDCHSMEDTTIISASLLLLWKTFLKVLTIEKNFCHQL